MDCATFWQSNPRRVDQFLEAVNPYEKVDREAWAVGFYVAQAIGACLSKEAKYPEKPNLFGKPQPSEEPVVEDGHDYEAGILARQFSEWAEAFNASRHAGEA